jgi:hypothetical protein
MADHMHNSGSMRLQWSWKIAATCYVAVTLSGARHCVCGEAHVKKPTVLTVDNDNEWLWLAYEFNIVYFCHYLRESYLLQNTVFC